MRNLLFLLILVNVMAYAYQAWIIAPASSVDPFHYSQAVPGLMTATAPATQVDAGAATGPAYRCFKIGPFNGEAEAATVQNLLQRREATVRQIAEEGRVWVGHSVQVAVFGGEQAAKVAKAKLEGGGLPEAYILPGANFGSISLGVYRSLASAEGLVAKAKKIGYEAKIVERFQPGKSFWLRVRLPDDRKLDPAELRTDSGQILRTEALDCATADI